MSQRKASWVTFMLFSISWLLLAIFGGDDVEHGGIIISNVFLAAAFVIAAMKILD